MDNLEVLKALRELTESVGILRMEVMRLAEMTRNDLLRGKWLTLDEACKYLRISRTTMQRRLADGEIGFAVKQGKSWKFPAEELKRYASAC